MTKKPTKIAKKAAKKIAKKAAPKVAKKAAKQVAKKITKAVAKKSPSKVTPKAVKKVAKPAAKKPAKKAIKKAPPKVAKKAVQKATPKATPKKAPKKVTAKTDPNATWSDKRVKELKRLWDMGLSITEIGKQLNVSRNSVAGKVDRMDLKSRASPINKSATKSTTKSTGKPLPSINEVNPEKLPLALIFRRLDWSRNKCSWPVGHPSDKDFSFCEKPVIPGKPYCANHCLTAYTNTREGSN